MLLQYFGLTLKEVEKKDLELIRTWRNDPKISQFMVFRENISPDMQREWFKKIQGAEYLYFLILHKLKPIGLTELKDINFVDRIAQGGIFIYDNEYLNSLAPFVAVFLRNNYAFQSLGLDELYCYVLETNKRAIRFNKFLGYEPVSEILADGRRRYSLQRDTFERRAEQLRVYFDSMFR